MPEIIYGATVYGANGCIAVDTLGFPAYSKGFVPVIADVDEDGKMELVLGNGIYEWDKASRLGRPRATSSDRHARGPGRGRGLR